MPRIGVLRISRILRTALVAIDRLIDLQFAIVDFWDLSSIDLRNIHLRLLNTTS
jgi:hypothetical protein